MMMASPSHAASLGRITVYSSLSQSLHAEIEVNSVVQSEQGAIVAKLARAEEYRLAGLDVAVLPPLKFSFQQRDGKTLILVNSDLPIMVPVIDLLIELRTPNGRMTREYNLLIDPIEVSRISLEPTAQTLQGATLAVPDAITAAAPITSSSPTPTAAVTLLPAPILAATIIAMEHSPAIKQEMSSAPVAVVAPTLVPSADLNKNIQGDLDTSSVIGSVNLVTLKSDIQAVDMQGSNIKSSSTLEQAPSVSKNDKAIESAVSANGISPKVTSASVSHSESGDIASRYTIASGDSLFKIAKRSRIAPSGTEQYMVAIYRSNMGAFLGGNINRMRRGYELTMPSAEDALKLSGAAAHDLVMNSLNGTAMRATEAEPPFTLQKKLVATSEVAKKKDTLKISHDTKDYEIEMIAREKALGDSKKQITHLEGMIKSLQKMLNLHTRASGPDNSQK
jgi:pilus assembly protein FimV